VLGELGVHVLVLAKRLGEATVAVSQVFQGV
jgi:hypothetical protein